MSKLRGLTGVVAVLAFMTITASASASPPVNETPPTISPLPAQLIPGATLNDTVGTWSSYSNFVYQWLRCDASGQACAAIPGANGQTYELTDSDVGHTLRVQESASNSDGPSAPAVSDPTPVVTPVPPPPPIPTARPVITGQEAVGAVLTETPGTWSSAAPLTFSYQWYSCKEITVPPKNGKPGYTTLAPCKPIPGATQPSYTVTNADKPGDLYATVVATTASGFPVRTSPVTADVIAPTSYLGPGRGGASPMWALPRNIPSVPWILAHGGVTGHWTAPHAGHLDITWTAALNGKLVLIAKAHAVFRHRGRSTVTTRLTSRGKAAFAHNYLLGVSIAASFTRAGEKTPTVSDSSLNLITF